MSAPQPEVDVATALASALGLALDVDVKCGRRQPPTVPGCESVILWVNVTGGKQPKPNLGASVAGSTFYPSVQVMVLGDPLDEESALTRARSVRDALHTKDIPIGGGPAVYRSSLVRETDGLPAGVTTEDGRPVRTVNVDLIFTFVN